MNSVRLPGMDCIYGELLSHCNKTHSLDITFIPEDWRDALMVVNLNDISGGKDIRCNYKGM